MKCKKCNKELKTTCKLALKVMNCLCWNCWAKINVKEDKDNGK
jgi:hypothetical protein